MIGYSRKMKVSREGKPMDTETFTEEYELTKGYVSSALVLYWRRIVA